MDDAKLYRLGVSRTDALRLLEENKQLRSELAATRSLLAKSKTFPILRRLALVGQAADNLVSLYLKNASEQDIKDAFFDLKSRVLFNQTGG